MVEIGSKDQAFIEMDPDNLQAHLITCQLIYHATSPNATDNGDRDRTDIATSAINPEVRRWAKSLGGNQNFEKQFTIRQMKLIRDGTSEKEAFDQVHEGMEEELETYRINIEEAYSTIVEAEGGTVHKMI